MTEQFHRRVEQMRNVAFGLMLAFATVASTACDAAKNNVQSGSGNPLAPGKTPTVGVQPLGGADGLAGEDRFSELESTEGWTPGNGGVGRELTAYSSSSRLLGGVLFAPQVPPGNWQITMSCGPAALNMATAYLWGATVNQAAYIPKICGFLGRSDVNNCLPGGTSTTDLVRAAKAINSAPNTYNASGWTIARLHQEIDAGRPVVVAVRAGALPNRGYAYTGGHFVLVVGYDSANIVAHDPGTSGGAFKSYANANFTSAMSSYNGAVVVPMR